MNRDVFSKNKKGLFLRIVARALIVAIFASSPFVVLPQKTARAQDVVTEFAADVVSVPVADVGIHIKEGFWDAIAWGITKMAINRLTLSMVEWIRTGYKGGPSFLSNPDFFFRDLANQATGVFINEMGLNQVLCKPWEFSVKFALSFQKPYILKAECTLLDSLANFEKMSQNFMAKGWKGFMDITLNQQNNPYGAFMQAQSELAFRVGEERTKQKDDLFRGRGFFSITSAGECLEQDGISGQCTRYAPDKVVTPGSYVADMAGGVGLSPLRQAELADEINESLGIIAGEMILQALSQNKGLLNTSTAPLEEQRFTLSGGVSNSLGSLISTKVANLNRFINAKEASLSVIQNGIYPAFDALVGIRDASIATGYDLGAAAYVHDQKPASCLAKSSNDVILGHINALADANKIEADVPFDTSRARGYVSVLTGWLEEINSGSASTVRLEEITTGFNNLNTAGLDFSSPLPGVDTPAEDEAQALQATKDGAEAALADCRNASI